MKLPSALRFLLSFVTKPGTVGAVAPSSRRLAQLMADSIDWPNARNIVEFGPGTGAFTEQILSRMRAGTKFFAIEIDPHFVELLSQRFPGTRVYRDSVKNVANLCRQEGIEQIDAVICGLPWAAFSSQDQHEFLGAMTSMLRPGGQFATFAYLQGLLLPAGQRFKRLLPGYFSEVKLSRTEWINLPPAFVYRCRR